MGYRARHKRAKPLSRLSWILDGLFLDFALNWGNYSGGVAHIPKPPLSARCAISED